jgi:hypothetical protein
LYKIRDQAAKQEKKKKHTGILTVAKIFYAEQFQG